MSGANLETFDCQGLGPKVPTRERSPSNEKPTQGASKRLPEAMGFFFTYPQCPVPKEFMVEHLLKSFKLKEYVVAAERHEDGNQHLHVFIKLEKKRQFKPTMGDFIYEGVGYHGNYQIAKCWRAVQKYCIKEGDYLSNIDVKAAINKEGKKVDLDKVLKGEMKLTEYIEADPSRLLSLGKLQQGLEIYKSLKDRDVPDCVGFIPNTWGVERYNLRLICLCTPQMEKKEDGNSAIIGSGPGDQIVVRRLSCERFRIDIDAPSILVWKSSRPYKLTLSSFSSMNSLELKKPESEHSSSIRCVMAHISTQSKEECQHDPSDPQCSSCVQTVLQKRFIPRASPSSPRGSMSSRSPELRRTETQYLGKRSEKDWDEESSESSERDWLCRISNVNCQFM